MPVRVHGDNSNILKLFTHNLFFLEIGVRLDRLFLELQPTLIQWICV